MKKFTFVIAIFISTLTMAQTAKINIVEHFTNTRCSICAAKNPAMYDVLDQYPDVIHISYHPSSPYSNCVLSQHNPSENDERTNFYGLYGGTPSAALNGTPLPNQSPIVKTGDLDQVTDEMSAFSVLVELSEGTNNQMNVSVTVEKLSENSSENLQLYVALAEDKVQYAAPNGEDIHHDVFRLKLGNEIMNSMEIGETEVFTYSYSFDSNWVANEMFAYAILQTDTKEVVQADKSPLAGALTGIENSLIKNGELNIFPNPTHNLLNINNRSELQFASVSIYNTYGQLVLFQEFNDVINVENLNTGIYILQIQLANGKSLPYKFQKI